MAQGAGALAGAKLPLVAFRYLLDSNILSEPVRPQPSSSVMERLALHLDESATAAPVLHELEFGILRLPVSRRRTVLMQYFEQVISKLSVLPYDASAARWHARERAKLAKRGRLPAFVDGQIAAVAQANGLILVTRNEADFEIFQGLCVENWF